MRWSNYFPDFSAELQRKWKTFQDVRRHLCEKRMPYSMLFPSCLRVTCAGSVKFFDSPEDAEAWISALSPLHVCFCCVQRRFVFFACTPSPFFFVLSLLPLSGHSGLRSAPVCWSPLIFCGGSDVVMFYSSDVALELFFFSYFAGW